MSDGRANNTGNRGRPEIDAALDRLAATRRAGEEMTQTEIAAAVGCSKALISQIEISAFKKMRAYCLEKYGPDFFVSVDDGEPKIHRLPASIRHTKSLPAFLYSEI